MILSSPYRRFVLLLIVPLVLYWQGIVATFTLALRDDAYTHIFLILPISIVLLFQQWRSHRVQPQSNFRAGLVLLAVAILIGLLASLWKRSSMTGDVRLSLSMLALVIWWIGAFVCCFGTRAFRICVFPLLFLLWMVPVPQFVLGRIVSSLQQNSASAARLFFQVAGVPAVQKGVVLSVPGLTLEVAQECSSIRSSLMLLVTGMVLAHLLLRTTWGKTVGTLALIVLAVAKNGFRIFTLSVLAVYVDPGYLHGWLHHSGGVVFLLLSLTCFLLLLWLLGWVEGKATSRQTVIRVAPAAAELEITALQHLGRD